MSQRSSSPESDFAKPGATTIECISNAGHSVINHKSMGMYPERAIIRCHADSCPPSPLESNNVSSDGIFCVLPSYVLWAYFITMDYRALKIDHVRKILLWNTALYGTYRSIYYKFTSLENSNYLGFSQI